MRVFLMLDETALSEIAKEKYRKWQEENGEEVECEGYLLDDGFKLEEIVIDNDGDLEVTIYSGSGDACSGVYLSITLDFDEWFTEFIKHRSFDDLIDLLDRRLKDLEKVSQIVKGIKLLVKKAREIGKV